MARPRKGAPRPAKAADAAAPGRSRAATGRATVIAAVGAAAAALAAVALTGPAASLMPAALPPPSAEDAAFLAWFREGGGRANGVSVAAFPGMGRGVVAARHVRRMDAVVEVPGDLLVERKRILADVDGASPRRRAAWEPVRGETDEHLIALYLMEQFHMGDASPWAPYLRVLPAEVPRAPHFDDAALDELQDPARAAAARKIRADMEGAWRRLRPAARAIIDAAEEAVRPAELGEARGDARGDPEAAASFEAFQHKLALVASRALSFRGRRVLAPLADMFNYASTGEARRNAAGDAFLKHHVWDADGGPLRVLADRDTRRGAQVFEDYGDNPNSVYLEYHGFVPEGNPFDCVALRFPPARDLAAFAGNASEQLGARVDAAWGWPLPGTAAAEAAEAGLEERQRQLGAAPSFCVGAQTSDVAREHPNLFQYAAVVLAGGERRPHCDALISGRLKRRKERASVARRCLPREGTEEARAVREVVAAVAADAASAAFATYATALEGDAAILAALGEDDEHRALAVRFRMGQKRALAAYLASTRRARREDAAAAAAASDGVEPLDAAVRRFNGWIGAHDFPARAIEAKAIPGYRLGAVATRSVRAEELYLAVPESVIMGPASAFAEASGVRPILQRLRGASGRGDPFHELLLHLLWERFEERERSRFWPYLQLLPQPGQQDSPLFLSEDDVAALAPSAVMNELHEYRIKAHRTFEAISELPLLQPPSLPEGLLTMERYMWAHAILDSRSIWWSGERHLVPLLDLINCGEGPRPDRVHATRPNRQTGAAETLADRDYRAGEQLFENYGQMNRVYFVYHGFVMEGNSHDAVELAFFISEATPGLREKGDYARYLRRMGLRIGVNNIAVGGGPLARKKQGLSREEGLRDVPAKLVRYVRVVHGEALTPLEVLDHLISEVLTRADAYAGHLGPGSALRTKSAVYRERGAPAAVGERAQARLAAARWPVRRFLEMEEELLAEWLDKLGASAAALRAAAGVA